MALEKECAEFVRWALTDGSWSGCDLEGGSIQDMALSLGLIKAVPFDPEIHDKEMADQYDVKPGDTWYILADGVVSLLPSSE